MLLLKSDEEPSSLMKCSFTQMEKLTRKHGNLAHVNGTWMTDRSDKKRRNFWFKLPSFIPRMCLTSNLAKPQLSEPLRPHPTSFASLTYSPEMLRKPHQFRVSFLAFWMIPSVLSQCTASVGGECRNKCEFSHQGSQAHLCLQEEHITCHDHDSKWPLNTVS